MDYRNIRRCFLFNKVLAKTNKHYPITGTQLYLLYGMQQLDGENNYVKVKRLLIMFTRIKRTIGYNELHHHLKVLAGIGFVLPHVSAANVTTYRLTIPAINVLRQFEKVLSCERWQK